jgi:hypothetical protein
MKRLNLHLVVQTDTLPFPPATPCYEEIQLWNFNTKPGVILNLLLGIKKFFTLSRPCDSS